MELANRVKQMTPSSTLAIAAKSKELKQAGYDVIGLGVGEPDFNTPDFINEAAIKALQEGHTKYTPAGGIPELKAAIANKFKQDNELDYTAKEIIVTTGAKHALYTLFQVILNPEDEVIVPAPYWVSYPEQIKLAEGKPVIVEANEKTNYKITPEQLEAAITEKTKAVIINSPSNPTGMTYTEQELLALGEVCVKHQIWIVSDEIYEKLIYTTEKHISIAQLSPALKNLTIVINGVSKSHAMTGWRIGYAAGDADIIKAMSSHASHATSNPTSIAQYAALAAYTATEDPTVDMRKVFSERLDLLYNLLEDIPGFSCTKPHGAFYLFPHIAEAVKMNQFNSTEEWVEALLEEEKVAVVPGGGFGAPDNIRLSYATSTEALIEAAKRMKRFVENHS
ncbi:pyridoxal phosphate-dependent aminotransferase [Ornithinibacillus gellani]|uniref:pyridoxal phosphate-dependent aminotransferase n=1 Tax=Ornithinibacillus gellani TaxID=2293253 RepID=UPI000F4950F8|nr:pyridoxal phosphate-dependent aminotransferase [Ornithinibacillus gellani]TQS74389.1 pyridoxal phosphate-dependent aminotransferase [Ornithinibacillus gellani]